MRQRRSKYRPTEVGTEIRARRQRVSITQADLADNAGISRVAMSRIESGFSWPRRSNYEKIDAVLREMENKLPNVWTVVLLRPEAYDEMNKLIYRRLITVNKYEWREAKSEVPLPQVQDPAGAQGRAGDVDHPGT